MLHNRNCIEQHLWWEPKGGSVTIWYDNWTMLDPLYNHQSEVVSCHPLTEIGVFMNEAGWDYEEMQNHIPAHIVDHVRNHMDHVRQSEMGDKPWWTKTSSGKFSIKNAWEILRKKDEVSIFLRRSG